MGNPYAPRDPGASVAPPAPVNPTPQAPQAPLPSEPKPVDPAQAQAATRSVLHFGLLMLATLVATTLQLPWQLIGLITATAAVVVGLRALRRTWRAGMRGALVGALSAGLVMTVTVALTIAAVIPVWRITMDHQDCMATAITHTGQASCRSAYDTAIKEFRNSLTQ